MSHNEFSIFQANQQRGAVNGMWTNPEFVLQYARERQGEIASEVAAERVAADLHTINRSFQAAPDDHDNVGQGGSRRIPRGADASSGLSGRVGCTFATVADDGVAVIGGPCESSR